MISSPTTPARSIVATAAAAVTLFALVGCAPSDDDENVRTTLTVAVDQIFVDTWDPIQGGFSTPSWQAVFDSLTLWDPDTQSYLPNLASEISLSEDRQTMTFELRDDVTFVDGEHMDAAGVEKFYDAVLASETYTFAGTIAGYETEFTATGEYTLEMTTVKPIYPVDFWLLLSHPTPVLSPAAVDDPEKALAEPLGSGPYLLGEVVPDVQATFVRNPDYWNADAYPFDTLVLKVLADPTAKLNALKSGQVDAAPLTLPQVAEAEASGLALNQGGGAYYALYAYDPNQSTLAPLRDTRVRQAIAMAFDRDAITETIDLGYGTSSSQVFIEGEPEYIEGGDGRYPFDPGAARDLLAEAGYPDGFDVTIPTSADLAGLQPIVESALADIGIRVTFEPFPGALERFTAITSGAYPLILTPVVPINNLRLFTEDFPGFGRTMAYNAEVIDLITTIKEGSAEDSAAASQELGELILQEALYIPISRPAVVWGSADDVSVHVTRTVGEPEVRDFQRAQQ